MKIHKANPTTHFLSDGNTWCCIWDENVTYKWKNVTCKKCLKKRKK